MSGHAEPRDWGTIPPIKDLAPAAPSVDAPVPVTALAPSPARPPVPLPVMIAVGLAVLLGLVYALT
jgi:hypothetical protein